MKRNKISEKEMIDYNRSKIYQQLEHLPKPQDYRGNIPWSVQQQIAATNGMHYIDKIGKLKGYPQYELPVPQISEKN